VFYHAVMHNSISCQIRCIAKHMYICVMVIFPSTILLIFAILDLWLIQYYKMVQKKTHKKLQYTVLMQLFQIKSNGFHPSVFKVQGNKD